MRCNLVALTKLNAIPVEVYAMFVKYREGVRMLGTITSNDAEQEMMRLKKSKIRKGKPFEVLTNVMNLWVRLINEASTESQTLLDEGKFLTKYALKEINSRIVAAKSLTVDVTNPMVTYCTLSSQDRDEVPLRISFYC